MKDLSQQRNFRGLTCTITLAVLIHLAFIAQLIVALPERGLVLPQFAIPLLPHILLMYSFPLRYDFSPGFDSPFRLLAKILAALPASLLYAVCLCYAWRWAKRFFESKRGTK